MQTAHLSVKIHLFEINIGHLGDLCRSDERILMGGGGGGGLFFFFAHF